MGTHASRDELLGRIKHATNHPEWEQIVHGRSLVVRAAEDTVGETLKVAESTGVGTLIMTGGQGENICCLELQEVQKRHALLEMRPDLRLEVFTTTILLLAQDHVNILVEGRVRTLYVVDSGRDWLSI